MREREGGGDGGGGYGVLFGAAEQQSEADVTHHGPFITANIFKPVSNHTVFDINAAVVPIEDAFTGLDGGATMTDSTTIAGIKTSAVILIHMSIITSAIGIASIILGRSISSPLILSVWRRIRLEVGIFLK
ncbi:hypothetical protein GBF38_021456 [Nibea albiflora]|uniref:Uncharacterized protein n=1 Tax=Nibea albiflora TaxID=240163 RepID=A0ACB7FH73_NIBAL|nr:hypothetical protein GBF38_021456 [Nibea albiflora]